MQGQFHPYKRCENCGTEWSTQNDFLVDPSLGITRYRACFTEAAAGTFVFTHQTDHCQSGLSIPVAEFQALFTGTRYTLCKAGDDRCPLYCLQPKLLIECANQCSMAWPRSLISIINHKG